MTAGKKSIAIVEVMWGDAWASSRWTPLDDMQDQPEWCLTVGYLVKQNKTGYVIAATVDSAASPSVNAVMFIPRGMVKSVKVLRK